MLDFLPMLPALAGGLLAVLVMSACQSAPHPPSASPTAPPSSSPSATTRPVPAHTPTASLPETPSPVVTPTLDPAGLPAMRVAFFASANAGAVPGGSQDLWVMDADGSNRRLVAHYRPGAVLGELGAFSPDGCLYAATDSRQAVVIDIQTGKKVVIDRLGSDQTVVISNFAWSPDGSTLTYYRGGWPGPAQAVPQLSQVKRLADGSWSEPRTIPLDPSGQVMLPVQMLQDGRMLTQIFYGAGQVIGSASYLTDLTTGKSLPLSRPGSDQPVEVTDLTPEGRIVFEPAYVPGKPQPRDFNIYVGRITDGGAITDVVTLAPPQGYAWVLSGRFTPDGKGVLAVVQEDLQGGPKAYGLFSLLDDGTIRFTPLLSAQSSIMGHSPLGSKYAVVSVVTEGVTVSDMTGEIWLAALDGSRSAALAAGFWPVGLPICQTETGH